MTTNAYKLAQGIIRLSEASNWPAAKLEWALEHIYYEDEPDTCLCSHYPINEICTLRNKLNANTAIVGNCCVKKFMGLASDKIFQGLRRVKKDKTKSFNAETIDHAYRQKWINNWEKDFYLDIIGKRNLSEKQSAKKLHINNRIIHRIVNARPPQI